MRNRDFKRDPWKGIPEQCLHNFFCFLLLKEKVDTKKNEIRNSYLIQFI